MKPLGYCVGVEESLIETLRICLEHAVKLAVTCRHDRVSFQVTAKESWAFMLALITDGCHHVIVCEGG
ncbi:MULTISPECIES: hypothetical protein [Nitrosomonas]|uniref:hypothetical protein n=1 Tax=Nitrosomonas TaxID=914 RepID=UPI0011875954|nr:MULTISPECIES: hypothetical protein [Nitrosomonas]UVS60462.1 hypothetical protein NX761_13210 [Nitrosomonas sp. PLL12]